MHTYHKKHKPLVFMWKEEKPQHWCVWNLVVISFAVKLEKRWKHFHGVSTPRKAKYKNKILQLQFLRSDRSLFNWMNNSSEPLLQKKACVCYCTSSLKQTCEWVLENVRALVSHACNLNCFCWYMGFWYYISCVVCLNERNHSETA